MHHQSPVPPHLQQPLFIDTDINYSLDMSKFPGLDDPQYMYEPALLIAKQPEYHDSEPICTTMTSAKGYCSRSPSVYSSSGHTTETTKDALEELLNIIDSCSGELLGRLGTREPQPNTRTSRSARGSYGNIPCVQATQRRNRVLNQCCSKSNTSVCDLYSMMDPYHTVSVRGQSGQNVPNSWRGIENCNIGYNLSNVSSSYVSSKRKRSEEVSDAPVYKRQCHGMNSSNWFGESDVYSQKVPVFKELSSNRYLGLSY